jgi:hypothetical protein
MTRALPSSRSADRLVKKVKFLPREKGFIPEKPSKKKKKEKCDNDNLE